MKPLPAIGAGLLAAFLLLAPVAFAQAPTVSVSPTSVVTGQTLTITGTTTASALVAITVTNPASLAVAKDNAQANSAGDFTWSFAAGGSSAWVTGVYTVNATVGTQSATTTFTYTATAAPPSGNQLTVLASASSPVFAGQTAQIQAYVYWNANGSAASSSVKVTAWWVNPSGTVSSPATGTSDGNGFWTWSVSLPSSAPDGGYTAAVEAVSGTAWGYGLAGFSVNSQVASSSGLTAGLGTLQTDLSGNFSSLTSAIGALSTTLGTISTAVGTISTNVGTILTNIGSLTSTVSSINSQVTTMSGELPAAGTISATQTYVLVVAVLAAITLVLELAILVRKIS